jgi:hypothetical protein
MKDKHKTLHKKTIFLSQTTKRIKQTTNKTIDFAILNKKINEMSHPLA